MSKEVIILIVLAAFVVTVLLHLSSLQVRVEKIEQELERLKRNK